MKEIINVHIADDHKIIIEGLIAVLNTDKNIEVKGYSLTGKQVIDWFYKRKNTAHVLILDLTMPEIEGIDVLRYFYKKGGKQKIIVLSSYDEVKIVEEVLKYGGYGYISKDCAGEHILPAIKAVYRGEQYFSSNIKSALLKNYSDANHKIDKEIGLEKIESLTDSEIKILRFITEELSTNDIAKEMNISAHTVETHRKKLKTKLNVKTSIGLAVYAVKYKLV